MSLSLAPLSVVLSPTAVEEQLSTLTCNPQKRCFHCFIGIMVEGSLFYWTLPKPHKHKAHHTTTREPSSAQMSDNEYGDGEGGEEYDVFANEDDDPQMDEPAPLEADPADMEVVDAGDAGGAGLRTADDRITTKYMTKYERARILGTRALQIR